MVIETLITHPERLGRQSLYDLRKITAEHPYYQPARILLLKNLFLLHDPTFDDELRRAAIFLTDRRVLFDIVEASHYKIKESKNDELLHDEEGLTNRASSLIDEFLDNIPADVAERDERERKVITKADAQVDYMGYLMATSTESENKKDNSLDIIDDFLNKAGGKLTLKDKPEYIPEMTMANDSEEDTEENEVLTENMANIYIKQGRYDKALSVMKTIHKKSKKKNPYFEDQVRFLQKLIISQQK